MVVKLRRRARKYPDLTSGRLYSVIGIEGGDLRLLNDQGRPYLYPAKLFEIVDPREPEDWISEFGKDGERYAYPPPLDNSGFFEDFFDGKPQAVAAFWQAVNQRLATHDLTLAR
jgi:hypothetical protein